MEVLNEETEPRYVISVAARILNTQTYTLRYYEKIGIIEPSRSQGNIRLYSEQDIAILRRVRSLMEDMGINLAGVQVILRMMQSLSEIQDELEQARTELQKYREVKGK